MAVHRRNLEPPLDTCMHIAYHGPDEEIVKPEGRARNFRSRQKRTRKGHEKDVLRVKLRTPLFFEGAIARILPFYDAIKIHQIFIVPGYSSC